MVIVCDFDDTAADQNVAVMLLERFGDGKSPTGHGEEWRHLHQQFLDRRIPLWQYQEYVFSRMSGSREEQAAFVRAHAPLRPGFQELAAFCAEHGVGLAIVSHGLDYYVEAALEEHGLAQVPFYTVETTPVDGGTAFTYGWTRPGCDWWGNCKCRVVEGYRAQGHEVVYAADGLSDACPARQADFVFARSHLLGFCRREGIPHQEFSDFYSLIAYLREMHAQGALGSPAPVERLAFD